VLTQYAVSAQVVDEENQINLFWQQVAWRAPGMREGTTLFVNYPDIGSGDKIDAVTGPANFIYYPEYTGQIPVTYKLYAIVPTAYAMKDIVVGQNTTAGYRTHVGEINYDKMLVISQPSESSCVHVIDQRWPLFSAADSDQIFLTGARSKVENILTDKKSPKLDKSIFGPEPAHEWCYTFEKAELAIQMGDWEKAASLGNDAIKSGFHPTDLVEWTPFLQAYAYLGDEQAFKGAASKIKTSSFVRLQACDTLSRMQKYGYSFGAKIQAQIENLCSGYVESDTSGSQAPTN
jgi:hypothetical protein